MTFFKKPPLVRILLAIALLWQACSFAVANPSVLAQVLTRYDFKTRAQQVAVVELLYLGGAFEGSSLETDLKAADYSPSEIQDVQGRIPKNFDAAKLLDSWTLSSVEKTNRWFVESTQRLLFRREAGQERWQQAPMRWMLDHEARVRTLIAKLGLTKGIAPQSRSFDAIVIFGATRDKMQERLAYAKSLVEKSGAHTGQIYLLTGERFADPQVDGGMEFLATLTNGNHRDIATVNETDLMTWAYETVKGEGAFAALPVKILEAQCKGKQRANTIDTLELLGDQAEIGTEIQSLLFVSSAPYIGAQTEAVNKVLKDRVHFEVVGEACQNTPEMIHLILGELGAKIYARNTRLGGV